MDLLDVLCDALAANDPIHRIAIVGGPNEDRAALARILAAHHRIPVRHADLAVARYAWSQQSEELSHWLDDAGPWVIEGAALMRAIRKWCGAHPAGRPCTLAVFLNGGTGPLAAQSRTIWQGFAPALEARGVVTCVGLSPVHAGDLVRAAE